MYPGAARQVNQAPYSRKRKMPADSQAVPSASNKSNRRARLVGGGAGSSVGSTPRFVNDRCAGENCLTVQTTLSGEKTNHKATFEFRQGWCSRGYAIIRRMFTTTRGRRSGSLSSLDMMSSIVVAPSSSTQLESSFVSGLRYAMFQDVNARSPASCE